MQVILTEKPSVARDIAKCLNVSNRRDGYFEGKGYQITWAFGHLVELQEPDEYHKEWKRWTLQTLPIIPEKFALKARGDAAAKKQLNTIKQLFKSADNIICATDAGREGELIFRYILSWSQCMHKPFQRLWISSLTNDAIRQGFSRLKDGREYDPLYRAAKCRSEADWIVGLNSTRLYTLKYGQNKILWSVGRVQTPVLALIVKRDQEISNFIAEDYWELQTLYRNTLFQYVGGRFDEECKAEALLKQIKGHEFIIDSIKGRQEKLNPPLLFDLTDLQKHMGNRHAFTADQTLKCAQKLYEKKHITYPRTDSRCLSNDMRQDMKPLLTKLNTNYPQQIEALDLDNLSFSKRYFNDAKISDHHAIIPTKAIPASLSPDEAKVYQAIVLRFIASFYPVCLKKITTVFGSSNQSKFKTTGVIIESPGWQVLFNHESADHSKATNQEQKSLPAFKVNDSGPHEPMVKKGRTKPSKPYTEATLLTMMESAGKTCEDEELKEALKEKGLGTPATRASIIEILIARKYIQRKKKILLSTDSGRHLISIIADERLKSPAMTGEWESRLKKIEQKAYNPDAFMTEIIQFTHKITDATCKPLFDESQLGQCPLCRSKIIEGKQGYGCSSWKQGCKFVLWKEAYGVPVSREMACELLQNLQTNLFYAIKINDEVFDAQLSLNTQGELGYTKIVVQTRPQNKSTQTIADCPLCNGKIIETAKAYSCSEWQSGCKMVIWKTIAKKKITQAMAKKLLSGGETGILKGFKSNSGNDFEANLKLINGKVEMDFSGKHV